MKPIVTSGKRKRAIARVTLREGSGNVSVNKKSLDSYEPRMYRLRIWEPIIIAGDVASNLDIDVNVYGGGMSSQADASRLAIAKALVQYTKGDKLKESFLKGKLLLTSAMTSGLTFFLTSRLIPSILTVPHPRFNFIHSHIRLKRQSFSYIF